MESLDYLLVGICVVFLIGMGVYLNRRQRTAEDYYVGGRSVAWWASGTSTMATQLGTISFVPAPAFVLAYCLMGLFISGFALLRPGFKARGPAALLALVERDRDAGGCAHRLRDFPGAAGRDRDSPTRSTRAAAAQLAAAVRPGGGLFLRHYRLLRLDTTERACLVFGGSRTRIWPPGS